MTLGPEEKTQGEGDQILRVSRNRRYRTIHLKAVDDAPELSWKAVGLLVYLVSRPPGWKIYLADLYKRHSDGSASVHSGIQELTDQGYLRKKLIRGDGGRFSSWRWYVSEVPLEEKEWGETFPDFHDEDPLPLLFWISQKRVAPKRGSRA